MIKKYELGQKIDLGGLSDLRGLSVTTPIYSLSTNSSLLGPVKFTDQQEKQINKLLKKQAFKTNLKNFGTNALGSLALAGLSLLYSYGNSGDSLTNSSQGMQLIDQGLGTAADALGYGQYYQALKAGVNFISKGLDGMFDKHNDTFYLNQAMAELVGGDYADNMDEFNYAASQSGKKKHWYQSTEDFTLEKRDLLTLTRKANESRDTQDLIGNMNETNSLAYWKKTNGANMNWLRAAKLGDKIELIKKRKKHFNSKVTSNKLGGKIWQPIYSEPEWKPIYSERVWQPVYSEIDKFLEGGKTQVKNRTLEELIEYAKLKNPRFILRMSEPVKDIEVDNWDGNKYLGKARATHMMRHEVDENGNWYVYSQIQEDENKNLKDYGNEAFARALKTGNILPMNSEQEAALFAISPDSEHGYKKGWPEFFKQFKQGGKTEGDSKEESNQKSIIPEGALHAHKHHMEDNENITKKGIPVVDMEGELQAEIERDEIILNLTLTNKLEELYKEFYNENTKLKRKDELAIEAGKLLTEDIMNNLDDRTGLVDKCLKGGKLNEN